MCSTNHISCTDKSCILETSLRDRKCRHTKDFSIAATLAAKLNGTKHVSDVLIPNWASNKHQLALVLKRTEITNILEAENYHKHKKLSLESDAKGSQPGRDSQQCHKIKLPPDFSSLSLYYLTLHAFKMCISMFHRILHRQGTAPIKSFNCI